MLGGVRIMKNVTVKIASIIALAGMCSVLTMLLSACLTEGGEDAFTGTTYENTTRSGHVFSNERWKGIIDITGDVSIHASAIVTIEPGTIVRFAAGSDDQSGGETTRIIDRNFLKDPAIAPSQISSLDLYGGTLSAVGTADNPILFTSSAPNPTAGDWLSIGYNVQGSKLLLQDTIIEYGFYGVQIITTADDSNISIRDSTIRHIVTCAICSSHIKPVTITISGNDISDVGHECIATHIGDMFVVENNTFHDNLWSFGGGACGAGIHIENNNSIVRNNQFIRNRVGIAISGNSEPTITGNTFIDNDENCHGFCPDPLQ